MPWRVVVSCARISQVRGADACLTLNRKPFFAAVEMWEFPKIRGTLFGGSFYSILLFRVLY